MNPELSSAKPLDQLRDLHLPAEVGLWPPAPGWWMLSLLMLSALFYLGFRMQRYRQQNRYRRLALVELEAINGLYSQEEDKLHYLQQLNQLLRRVALIAYPHRGVAELTGATWLAFLAGSSSLTGFEQTIGQPLATGPYQPALDCDLEQLGALAKRWIQVHHPIKTATFSRVDPC